MARATGPAGREVDSERPEATAARAGLVASYRTDLEGRDVILLGGVVRDWVRLVDRLASLGARRMMVIATGEGTGTPLADSVQRLVIETPARSMAEEVFGAESLVARIGAAGSRGPSTGSTPTGAPASSPTPFVLDGDLGGRPVPGRRRDWADLEYKATVDDLLAAPGWRCYRSSSPTRPGPRPLLAHDVGAPSAGDIESARSSARSTPAGR